MKRALTLTIAFQLLLLSVALAQQNATITPEDVEEAGCQLIGNTAYCPQLNLLFDLSGTLTGDVTCLSNETTQDLGKFICGTTLRLSADLRFEAQYRATNLESLEQEDALFNYTLKAEEYDALVDGEALDASKCTFSGTEATCSYKDASISFDASILPSSDVTPEVIIIHRLDTGGAALALDANLLYVALGVVILVIAFAALRKKQK